MKKMVLSIIILAMTAMTNAQNVQNKAAENSMLQLVNEWDTQHFVRFFKQRTGMTPKSIGMWDNKNDR